MTYIQLVSVGAERRIAKRPPKRSLLQVQLALPKALIKQSRLGLRKLFELAQPQNENGLCSHFAALWVRLLRVVGLKGAAAIEIHQFQTKYVNSSAR